MMKKGFTLIELMIVVGIVVILATIGVPNYLSTRSQKRLELAVEVLVRELNFTMERSRSQEDGKQWWIHFDNPVSGNNFYVVCHGAYTGSGVDCVAEGGAESKRTVLGSGLEFTEPASGTTKDAVFSKATGLPTACTELPTACTIVTINSVAGGGSKTIIVSTNSSIVF